MTVSRITFAAAAVVLLGLGLLQAFQAAPSWPPPVQELPENAEPLSVDDALDAFFLPPGYYLDVVAAEPLVRDPIVMDQDADGRLYVIEMPAFAIDETMRDSKEPICRVVVLEDTDNDGKMDKRTIFADRLVLPRAVKWLDQGVLIAEPPNLWLFTDSDGDLMADDKKLIRDDFGRAEANIEHNANGLYWGMDNTLYTSEWNYNLRWKDGEFIKEDGLVRGQWNVSQDDGGRIYRNWNEEPLFADIVAMEYFVRNPNQVRTRGLYESLIAREDTYIWPVRPTPGLQRAYRPGMLREDGTATTYASSADPWIFRGDRLPEEVRGAAFVADSPTNLVHLLRVNDDGSGRLSAEDFYKKGEIIASTDERFRAVNMFSAADGTLYVLDMYRGVVQDIAYQTEYLNTYIKQHSLELPTGYGRIYRLRHEEFELGPKPSMSDDTPDELVAHLSHPNGWWRDMAQQLLVQRKATAVAPKLKQLATSAPDWRTKLHALWTLDGLDAIDAATVEKAMGDGNPDVRAAAVRISERWLGESGHALAAKVKAMADDANWKVRYQLAASLGELPKDQRLDPVAGVLEKYGSDPILVDAAISGLAGLELDMLGRVLPWKDAKYADLVTQLAATVARSRDGAGVQQTLLYAAEGDRPAWQRRALVEGVDTGLTSGGGFGSSRAPEPLSLGAEPKALTDPSGGLEAVAESAAAKLTWPGKPAPPPSTLVLTAEEKQRVAHGQELYSNFCAGCHMPTGTGDRGGKTNLVDSEMVLGNPNGVMRVILGGKDGETGLMPPLKGALDDEQIAAVISYIRTSWGNEAFPISAADVVEVRGVTQLRKEPWTDEELEPMLRRGYRPPPVIRQ